MSCFAADITTRDGTTYHNAQVTGVDPDGIHVTHSIGVAKLRFEELPDALQKQYHYDPGKVAAYRKQIGDQEKTSAAQDAAAQQTEMHATAAQHATGTHGAADLSKQPSGADCPRSRIVSPPETNQSQWASHHRRGKETAFTYDGAEQH
jgi:hypothetical protein